MNKLKQPKILIFDIETTLLMSYLFSLGKQVVRHTQLVPGYNMWDIICIAYCWAGGGPVQCIKWTPERGTSGVIEDFDLIIKQADICIGKNNKSFDNKHINVQRMLSDLPAMPEWIKSTGDLEQQMRKYFKLPSQSLDYISMKLGFGGKSKMEFQDWVDISQYMTVLKLESRLISYPYDNIPPKYSYLNGTTKLFFCRDLRTVLYKGASAFHKMCKYCEKDTNDTRKGWNKMSAHFEPILNVATFNDVPNGCKKCGATHLQKHGIAIRVTGQYQKYLCVNCGYVGNFKHIPIARMM